MGEQGVKARSGPQTSVISTVSKQERPEQNKGQGLWTTSFFGEPWGAPYLVLLGRRACLPGVGKLREEGRMTSAAGLGFYMR